MMTARLALAGLLVGQSAAAPSLVVPDAPDLMIKTRRTADPQSLAVSTEVLYLKGARQRRQWSIEDPQQAHFYGPRFVTISQCDQRRTLLLNPEVKTYVYHPIEDPAEIIARLRADGGKADVGRQAPPRQRPTGPTVTITTDAVDTGERRQFGHYVARHVITTRTTEPGPGARSEARLDRQDGWYIDVPEQGCTASEVEAMLIGFVASGAPPDIVQFKQRGKARRGYPIEETFTSTGRYTTVNKLELLELSEAPLDAALFTVPSDYRAALPSPYRGGGYDLSKPDTVLNRVESYRQVVVDWANYIRRNGLLGILPGTQAPARY